MLIPSGSGGGYDLYARFLAGSSGNTFPATPRHSEECAWAGGIVAGNNLMTLSAPDGLTMAGLQFTNTLNQMVKTQNMRFDMRKLRGLEA